MAAGLALTGIATATVATAALWPAIGALSLLAAPFVASAATLGIAVLASPPDLRRDLDAGTDEMVATLRELAAAGAAPNAPVGEAERPVHRPMHSRRSA